MMKTVLAVVFLTVLGLIWFHRERVFLRDPVATVYRDGVAQSGVQVFMNGSDEVLLEKDDTPNPYRILIERANPIPGRPVRLWCLRWIACLTEADQAPVIPLEPLAETAYRHSSAAYNPQVAIADRESSFTMPDGARLRIALR